MDKKKLVKLLEKSKGIAKLLSVYRPPAYSDSYIHELDEAINALSTEVIEEEKHVIRER